MEEEPSGQGFENNPCSRVHDPSSPFSCFPFSIVSLSLFSPSSLIFCFLHTVQFISVQSLSWVWLFVTPWTVVCQASLSITKPRSLFKLMSIESVMPFNYLILCHPFLSFCLQSSLASGSFPMSQFFASGGQSIRVSASLSVLPMNTQDWSPLGWTGWISLQSKGLSRVFSNTTVQKHQLFSTQLSL